MKTNINFVYEYFISVEVYYKSGKTHLYHKCEIPATVRNFMNNAADVHKFGKFEEFTCYRN